MPLDFTQHPCFNADTRHRTGRIHLPVAPRCNMQCNYCDRKFDCMNESRPGVTSALLSPGQAVSYLAQALDRMPELKVAGIAGPGDPFANPEPTLATLRLVRQRFPELLLCVASNGLNIGPHIEELADLQVSHVTLTVNAVDPDVAAPIYAWIRERKVVYRGKAAGEILVARQRAAIRGLKARNVAVKINTIVVPGVNEGHIEEIANEMASLGADIMNCIPLYPVKDTAFAAKNELSGEAMAGLRLRLAHYLPQMNHCTRCRADAAGLLGEAPNFQLIHLMRACASGSLNPEEDRPYVAVASMEGTLVNQHLGEAEKLWIFAFDGDRLRLIDTRQAPASGGGSVRWREMAQLLRDCRALMVSGVGATPRRVLAEEGLRVVEMAGLISEGVAAFFRTGSVPPSMRRQFKACGTGCAGNGVGCA